MLGVRIVILANLDRWNHAAYAETQGVSGTILAVDFAKTEMVFVLLDKPVTLNGHTEIRCLWVPHWFIRSEQGA